MMKYRGPARGLVIFNSPFVCQVSPQPLPITNLNASVILFSPPPPSFISVCSLLAGAEHQRALPTGGRLCRCHWPEDERVSRHV